MYDNKACLLCLIDVDVAHVIYSFIFGPISKPNINTYIIWQTPHIVHAEDAFGFFKREIWYAKVSKKKLAIA